MESSKNKNNSQNKRENDGKSYPYINTINKNLLDFDQEKICSITLKTNNIYSCLICGKYFHGKGKTTPCYIHSLSEQHHLFINLETRAIYCLPDDYELIENQSNKKILYEIKQNLLPVYTKEQIKLIDKISANYNLSLDNKKYFPGYIGLGYVKNCEYFNVIIQSLAHLKKFRDFFLSYNYKIVNKDDYISIFVQKLSEIIKKLWNFSSYKAHLDQRECLQLLSKASNNKFILNFNEKNNNNSNKNDIISFLSWLLNTLKVFFSSKNFESENIIEKYFQGILEIETYILITDENRNSKLKKDEKIIKKDGIDYIYSKSKVKFLYLTLDLPMAPLFKDSQEKITIPQINIYELFTKFNGIKYSEEPTKGLKRKIKILSLPKYLILIFKRFENNSFFMEKNPTIINFQIEGLIVKEKGLSNRSKNTNNEKEKKYNLIANVIHDGKPGDVNYRVQIKHKERNEWFEIQDIHVQKILPESVVVGESYIHFYEQVKDKKEEEK